MYGIPNTNPDPQHHIQLQFFFFKKRCDTLSVDEPVDKLILCPTQKLAHQNSVIPFLLINRSAPSWQINFVSCTVYTPKKNTYRTFSVDEPLRLPDKDLVALVILGGDQDDGPLGTQQAQQDLGRRLHLLL